MSCWLAWPPAPSSLGPCRRSLGRLVRLRSVIDAVATLDHDGQLLFHHRQGRDDFSNSLAGQILEIAGFIHAHDLVLDVLSEAVVIIIA